MSSTEHAAGGELPRSLDLLWGNGKPPGRGPKPGLTQRQIVSTAVELANSAGLSALSMRRVAGELGVGTMSLYRYVPNKAVLLDLMIDHVNAPGTDTAAPPEGDWRSALQTIALDNWRLYTDNPWLLQVNQSRPLLGPGSLDGFELSLAPLDGLGLTGKQKIGILATIDNFVLGAARSHVLATQAAAQSGVSDDEFWSAQLPYLDRAMASGRYPQLAALEDDVFGQSDEELLRFGLEALLDGFATLIGNSGSGQH